MILGADDPLLALFAEALDGGRIARWLGEALDGRVVPHPIILNGDGAHELGHVTLLRLQQLGVDAVAAPREWVRPGGTGGPARPPRVLVLLLGDGLDEVDEPRVEALAEKSALMVCGNSVVPLLERARPALLLLALPAARAADLRLHCAAGWPGIGG